MLGKEERQFARQVQRLDDAVHLASVEVGKFADAVDFPLQDFLVPTAAQGLDGLG